MATPQQIEEAIRHITDQQTFINILLKQTLNWQIPDGIENVEEMSYVWSEEDLKAEALDQKVVEGKALQIQPLHGHEEWGIFLLEFNNSDVFIKGRGLAGPLRQVLRGLVRKKRQQANRPAWNSEDILFICTYNYQHYRFAYFKAPKEKEKTSPLSMFGWNHNDSEMRTLCQHNLPFLEWDKLNNWRQAFSIEKVTKEFYEAYARLFKIAEDCIGKENKELKNDKLRFFTQMLFNRLMFLRFIEKKGWLKFGEGNDYLKNLFSSGGINGKSFYTSRLYPLFFEGLAVEQSNCRDTVGDVPFLNGGLFEITELDKSINDIPDEVFTGIINEGGLFYHFNFTVEESTPFDIEVAVDPEMLGKVFEELVTGRHESGSYYTPRPIVSFMCKEALKGFISSKTSAPKEAIEKLVDDHEVTSGLTESHAEQILYYLDTVKACDPACGSGAYLLGLLQELIAIRRTLQNEHLLSDSTFIYKLKLGIISRSLYGVDKDEFATNVAKLRLWLSLAVEAEKPQPLPNLDFKVETGDSVLGPCTPDFSGANALILNALRIQAENLVIKKDKFMTAHGESKHKLFEEIKAEEKAIAEETETAFGKGVIAWHIHFAEVFVSSRRQQQIDKEIADIGDFKVTTVEPGGFDIVLANPPYIRQELIKDDKPQLKEIFPKTYMGTADLYTYFYTRAVELLGPGGMLVFISSNKWFRANYGQRLREFITDNCRIHSITDFGELPVFETAATFPMIFVAQKTEKEIEATFTQVKTLEPPYPDVKAIIQQNGSILPVDAIDGDSWNLADTETLKMLRRMDKAGISLTEYVKGEIYYGVKTGFNKAFIIDSSKREELIAEDPVSEDLLKLVVCGDDIQKWYIRNKNEWIIFARRGLDIDKYPAIKKHLLKFKKQLEPCPNNWPNNKEWTGRKPGTYKWYEIQDAVDYYDKFEKPKIILPAFAMNPKFCIDYSGLYANAPCYFIASDDLYLLGVMNSSIAFSYLQYSCTVLGDQDKRGRVVLRPVYFSKLPIPKASAVEKKAIENLVQKCLDAEGRNCEKWEKEIDEIVIRLYGLEGLFCQIPK